MVLKFLSPGAILGIQPLFLGLFGLNLIDRPWEAVFLSPSGILVIQSLLVGPIGPNLIDRPCSADFLSPGCF